MTLRTCGVSIVLALLLTGCGGESSHKTVPVSGRVTLDGKPLPNATVTFVPVAEPSAKDRPPSSVDTTDANGHYSLVLTGDAKITGAVVGKHKVIMTLGAQSAANDTQPTFHKQLPQRYNRQSELQFDVPAGGSDSANFDLTSAPDAPRTGTRGR